MIIQTIAFYVFAAICVGSGVMVISARNPVHSVLFLILAFFNAAGLFVLMGAEFLAMILVVVYVGAVAVLFLFVVMMLDVDFAELREGFLQYLPVGALVGIISNRDMRFEVDHNKLVRDVMTPMPLVTAQVGVTAEAALGLLRRHKVEKLPILDGAGLVVGHPFEHLQFDPRLDATLITQEQRVGDVHVAGRAQAGQRLGLVEVGREQVRSQPL